MSEQRRSFIELQPAYAAMILQIFSDARFVDAEMLSQFFFQVRAFAAPASAAQHIADANPQRLTRFSIVISGQIRIRDEEHAGTGGRGISALLEAGRVRRIVCSYPRSSGSTEFERLYERNAIELEVVPQGTLSERLRAAAAGLGGFYTPTAAGTLLAEGKEQREIDGRVHVFERPLRPDVALIHADRADRFGNLTYHSAARNFAPVMAAAARLTIVEARTIVQLGALDPEHVVTPGIFVDRVVEIAT